MYKQKLKQASDKFKNDRQSKIYYIVYQYNEVLEEDIIKNFDCDKEVIINDLNDLLSANVIIKTIKDNNAYYKINK